MGKEFKSGYGFLLAGVGVPYLIDKLLGPTYAIIAAVLCSIAGVAFLIAGHLHKESGADKDERLTIEARAESRPDGRRWLQVLIPVILVFLSGCGVWWVVTHARMEAIIAGSAVGELLEVQPTGSVMLNVDLINTGPPSITKNWTLRLRLSDGESFQGQEAMRWVTATGPSDLPWRDFHPSDFIDQKTGTDPVPTGGRVRGVIAFVFFGLPRERINDQGTELTLAFEDAHSRRSTTRYNIPIKVDTLFTPHL